MRKVLLATAASVRKSVYVALATASIATGAIAAPAYTTSVTVPYNAAAPSFCNPNCVFASSSNNSSYTVQTGADSTYFYVDVTSTPNANTDQSLQFANIYLGGTNFTNNLIIETTNNRASTTDAPGTYVSLAGTGFTFAQGTNDISFAIPFSFLETNPDGLNYGSVSPGDLLRISYSQSFGYSLVAGSNFNPVTRLGAQIVPEAISVPEPISLSLLGFGLIAMGAVRPRKYH